MTDVEILDPRFARLVIGHARLERLWTGARWSEGPVYVPAAKSLLWSDIPGDRVMRYDETDGSVSVFEAQCGFHNGHTLDREGRVVACLHGGRCISRLEHDGEWRVLADRFDGRRLNSPNDVVVHSDGSIWFSDPTYGIDSHYEGHPAPSEVGGSNVYRLDLDGTVRVAISDLRQPNGLAFSPDESVLYVADTGRTHDPSHPVEIVAYAMAGAGPVRRGTFTRSEADGLYDGFRVDRDGNVWTSHGRSIDVHAPDGTLIGRIPVPELVSNLAFGGRKRNRLYITAQTSLYALYVNQHPAGW